MTVIRNLRFLICLLLLTSFVICAPPGTGEDDKTKEDSDSSEEETNEKDLGTISPTEMEILKEKIMENQEENAERFGLPLTSAPEEIETFLEKEEKEYGKDLPEKVEESITDSSDLSNLVRFIALFDKIKSEASEGEDYENIEPKSPEEMKKMKAEVFKLANEQNEKFRIPKISQEDFDRIWAEKEEEYGEKFPRKIEKLIIALKSFEQLEKAIEEATLIPETVPETHTPEAEPAEEESPKDTFALSNAKGKICILAKFHSTITVSQTVHLSVPSDALVKGKCATPNRSPILQLSWKDFSFDLFFEKIAEDNWGVSLVEFRYDTSDPLFDEDANPRKITGKSKKDNLFETPMGKSYFCPGKEVIPLFSDDEEVGHVELKEIHLQAYGVEDGKFSAGHRCEKVVSLDDETFVQDETIPLAVGCTLALITLLILVGFSVHRAIVAARVDYNNME